MDSQMDVDRPQASSDDPASARQKIIQELVQRGFPLVHFDRAQSELVLFLQNNMFLLADAIKVVLPSVDVSSAHIVESLVWLQWLMFESEPRSFLEDLTKKTGDQRAVCGAVWGKNDLAYRCRTCEHDHTCAICVPCFQNGNHKDHDYSIIYTGGGCCDCGDITAWKQEGFCSKHRGIENIQRVSDNFPCSLGFVLDALFVFWKDRLLSLEALAGMENLASKKNGRKESLVEDNELGYNNFFANELTSFIVNMLLSFCNCSESLLYFISKRISASTELLQLLVEGEVFLDTSIIHRLHELLLKLQGEPMFKYMFGKAFVRYYHHPIDKVAKGGRDSVMDAYPLLDMFSVQIFTVPSLTLRLVKEVNLLDMLQECLGQLFHSCTGDDGGLQTDKLYHIFSTTLRVVMDIRFTLSHVEVPKHVAREKPDFIKRWVRLLSHVQGMDPQKRATSLHVEEENEKLHEPFVLEYYLQIINKHLIKGAFSVDETKMLEKGILTDTVDESLSRLSEVGRHAEEKSVSLLGTENSTSDFASESSEVHSCSRRLPLPPIVALSISEALRATEDWLEPEVAQDAYLHTFSGGGMSNYLHLQKHLFKHRKKSSSKVVGKRHMLLRNMHVVEQFPREETSIGASKSLNALGVTTGTDMDKQDVSILSSIDWPEITFDVSSEEISLHIPLHRFLSLGLWKAMEMYCNGTPVSEVAGFASVSLSHGDEFFNHILKGYHSHGFSSLIMEHPLRLRVFCAQVHAGMWRRNGDAGIYLSDYYHNVPWSNIGIEVDLFLLQCCAAVAPPELFVARIIERFALSSYLSLNIAEFNEYEPVLVQEMLTLLIQIVKERRFCGFSASENLTREFIHKLAVGDATHSQLIKALPHDLSKVDGIQKVLGSLATFTKPSGVKQGVYSLRKDHWRELDLYHPRWNVRDLQVAEERYLRFCKVSPLFVQIPTWTKIYSPLTSIGKIATSKMVFQIIRAVLFYAVYTEKPSTCRAPDDVLIRALHLLSLSLDICEMQRSFQTDSDPSSSDCLSLNGVFPILAHATDIIITRMRSGTTMWVHASLLSLLVALTKKHKKENDQNPMDPCGPNLSSWVKGLLKRFSQLSADFRRELENVAPGILGSDQSGSSVGGVHEPESSSLEDRKAKARKRQAAILEKMKAEQSKFSASLVSAEYDLDSPKSGSGRGQIDEEISPVCSLCHNTDNESPLSVIILLQRSRLSSLTDQGTPSWEDISQSGSQYSAPVKIASDWLTDDHTASSVAEFEFDHDELDHDISLVGPDGYQLVSADRSNLSSQKNSSLMETDSSFTISVSEDDIFDHILKDVDQFYCNSTLQSVGGHPFFRFAFGDSMDYQKTCLKADEHHSASSSDLSCHCSFSYSTQGISRVAGVSTLSETENKFGPVGCDGIYISSCGHSVHQQCHDRYLSTLRQRGLDFGGRHLVVPSRGEFLCPVCRRFANSILPLAMSEYNIKSNKTGLPSSRFFSVGHSSFKTKLDGSPCFQHALAILWSSWKMLKEEKTLNIAPKKIDDFMGPALESSVRKLRELYFLLDPGNFSETCRGNFSLLLWDTLTYSIVSTEIAARGKNGVKREGSVSSMELFAEELSSNGISLSALLHVSQIIRGSDHLQVQLRLKSLQLFASAICAGISGSDILNSGTDSSPLEANKNGSEFTTNFLKVAADPILLHDPFYSLMWLLYSLPLPFILSSECLMSLIHVFHVVCVIQALITCYGKHQIDESTLENCALLDICKAMGKYEPIQHLFVSHHIDCSVTLKDMVCRLTFPYLRKCALLWKLLEFPMPTHDIDKHSKAMESGVRSKHHCSDDGNNCIIEFELVELENMFQICSLDAICNNKEVQALTLEWSEHLCHYVRIHKQKNILYCNPAVPFRLMRLPLLYQDLLQRYNKEQCQNCGKVPEEPALCLFCGKICSPNWKQCCRESRCHIHAKRCGAGIGAFLLIKSTTILLQSSSRQSVWPSPYLDAFGEEDINVLRGKPLYLSEERYTTLTNLIASHGLDRSSEVLRRTAITF